MVSACPLQTQLSPKRRARPHLPSPPQKKRMASAAMSPSAWRHKLAAASSAAPLVRWLPWTSRKLPRRGAASEALGSISPAPEIGESSGLAFFGLGGFGFMALGLVVFPLNPKNHSHQGGLPFSKGTVFAWCPKANLGRKHHPMFVQTPSPPPICHLVCINPVTPPPPHLRAVIFPSIAFTTRRFSSFSPRLQQGLQHSLGPQLQQRALIRRLRQLLGRLASRRKKKYARIICGKGGVGGCVGVWGVVLICAR